MGRGDLHPVRQVRAGLPARRHPRQGLRPGSAGRRAGDVQVARRPAGRTARSRSYTLQVAPEDCTGCRLCVEVCPAKDKSETRHKAINMAPQPPLRERRARRTGTSSSSCPRPDRRQLDADSVKDVQLLQPLFEFSGACAGCGETPYLKLLTQLFGDRAADRQRDRLLVDLRRQPADDAVLHERARAAGRRGPTRCSRTTPSSAWACGWRSTSRPSTPASCCGRLGGAIGDELVDAICSTPTSRPRRASTRSASASRCCSERLAGIDTAEARRPADAWPTRW